MSTDNILKRGSIAFAKRIVYLCKHLGTEQHEYVLSKQIL